MSSGLLKMAEGYELVAAGLRQMIEAREAIPQVSTKSEDTNISEKAKKAKKEDEAEAKVETQAVKKVTLEEVRAVLADKSRAGKTQEVRMLLHEYGADKLSSVEEEKLSDLLAKAVLL